MISGVICNNFINNGIINSYGKSLNNKWDIRNQKITWNNGFVNKRLRTGEMGFTHSDGNISTLSDLFNNGNYNVTLTMNINMSSSQNNPNMDINIHGINGNTKHKITSNNINDTINIREINPCVTFDIVSHSAFDTTNLNVGACININATINDTLDQNCLYNDYKNICFDTNNPERSGISTNNDCYNFFTKYVQKNGLTDDLSRNITSYCTSKFGGLGDLLNGNASSRDINICACNMNENQYENLNIQLNDEFPSFSILGIESKCSLPECSTSTFKKINECKTQSCIAMKSFDNNGNFGCVSFQSTTDAPTTFFTAGNTQLPSNQSACNVNRTFTPTAGSACDVGGNTITSTSEQCLRVVNERACNDNNKCSNGYTCINNICSRNIPTLTPFEIGEIGTTRTCTTNTECSVNEVCGTDGVCRYSDSTYFGIAFTVFGVIIFLLILIYIFFGRGRR